MLGWLKPKEKYIIIWEPMDKTNKPYYQGQGCGTTYNIEEARVFENEKEAYGWMLKMSSKGYNAPTVKMMSDIKNI